MICWKPLLCVLLLLPATQAEAGLEWIAEHSGKCLDVEYASPADKARLVQWDCNGRDNQNIDPVELDVTVGGQQFILKVAHSGKCLDIPGGSDRNGTIIIQYECHKLSNQRFWLKQLGQNTAMFRVQNVGTNKCLDIDGAALHNRAKVILWDCHDGPNQVFRWHRKPAPDYRPSHSFSK